MRIFFGGPLTDLKDPEHTKRFYHTLEEIAWSLGFETYWAFERGTDPELNTDVPSSRVYQIDTYEVEKSDLMIAYVGEPSTGTGQEIEYARTHNVPVYLLYEKGKRVSRMTLGSPNIRGVIEYENEEDAFTQLRQLLERLRTRREFSEKSQLLF